MCLDLLCLICWTHYLEVLHHHIQEWPKHKELLQDVTDFLSALDSDRKHLSKRNVLVEDWQVMERSIREVKLQLDQIIRLVDWKERTGRFQFALRYKTATIYGHQLRASMERLHEVRDRMDFLKAKLKIQGTYFREERGRSDGALAQHFMRHLAIYSSFQLKLIGATEESVIITTA